MLFKHAKRRFITLVEIMIVMFLIAMITGVVAYNYRGTLEEGKAFKTKAAMEKISTILNMEVAEHPESMSDFGGDGWQTYVMDSPMIQDPKSAMKDGWGGAFRVYVDGETNQITVISDKYNAYQDAKRRK